MKKEKRDEFLNANNTESEEESQDMRNAEMDVKQSWARIRRGTTNEKAKVDTALNKMSLLPSYSPINLKHWCNLSVQARSAETKHVCVSSCFSSLNL